jgi:hypothetical protein
LEHSRADAEAVAFRLTITNAFILSATMITLSLNTSLIRQAFVAGVLGTPQWLLVTSIILMMFSALILLFLCFVILVNTPLAKIDLDEVLRRIDTGRLYVAASAFMLLASYGSLFLVSFGLSSPWSWVLSTIAYGSAIAFVVLRRYHLTKFATRKLPTTQ